MVSSRLQRYSLSESPTEFGYNPFKEGFKVVDCGDVPMTPLDNTAALKQLQKAHKVVL